MFRIIKFDALLKYVALATVVLSMAIFWVAQHYWFPSLSILKVITISSAVSGCIVFLLLNNWFSRKLWSIYRFFDKSVYPDLSGTWKGEIIPEGGKEIEARAVIRQSLVATQIDMHGATAKSITIETTPTIEQGQKKLYYVYRATPKNIAWSTYNGSTLFDVRAVVAEHGVQLELSGVYYTDRKTSGRIRLSQVSKDSNSDVSFY